MNKEENYIEKEQKQGLNWGWIALAIIVIAIIVVVCIDFPVSEYKEEWSCIEWESDECNEFVHIFDGERGAYYVIPYGSLHKDECENDCVIWTRRRLRKDYNPNITVVTDDEPSLEYCGPDDNCTV